MTEGEPDILNTRPDICYIFNFKVKFAILHGSQRNDENRCAGVEKLIKRSQAEIREESEPRQGEIQSGDGLLEGEDGRRDNGADHQTEEDC